MVQFYGAGLYASAVVEWLLVGLLVLSTMPVDTSGQVEQQLVHGPRDTIQATEGEENQNGIQRGTCLKMSFVCKFIPDQLRALSGLIVRDQASESLFNLGGSHRF